MSITVNQTDAGRPPIAVDVAGLPQPTVDGVVTGIVQRSTDGGISWVTVRGMAEAAMRGVADRGLQVDGATDRAATSEAPDVSGDLRVEFDITPAAWEPASQGTPVAKDDLSSQRSWRIIHDTDGTMVLQWWDGTSQTTEPSSDSFADLGLERLGIAVTLDLDNGSGGYTVTWETAGSIDGPWTTYGTPTETSSGTTSIASSTADLVAGLTSALSLPFAGIVHALRVYDGGVLVVDVDFGGQATGTTVFDDATGLEWAVAGGAEIVGLGDLDAVDDWEFRPGVVNTYRAGINQICDTFTRTEADQWGDTDTGQTWDESTGTAGSGVSVSGGLGRLLHTSASTNQRLMFTEPADVADVDMSVTVATDAGGAITGADVQVDLTARPAIDLLHDYTTRLVLKPSETTLGIYSRYFDVLLLSGLVTLPAYTGVERYRLRMRVKGHTIQAKVWLLGVEPEPDWMLQGTVPVARRIASGPVGLRTVRFSGNTNANLTFLFDDFVADIDEPQWISGYSDTITPTLGGFWLCSTMRSFLNLAPMVVDYQEPQRTTRGGQNEIVGRALPIGQAELMGSRAWTLTLRVTTLAEARNLEMLIASGDVLWLLTPAGCPIPSGYYRVASMAPRRVRPRGAARLFDLPLLEVAAPGPDVTTAQSTWDTVIGAYGSWEDLVAAHTSWDSVLALLGDPAEVVTDP